MNRDQQLRAMMAEAWHATGDPIPADWRRYKDDEPPIDVRTFVTHPYFLNSPIREGDRGVIYPAVMDEIEEFNSGKYIEGVLTGGIGSGKTTVALYSTAYQLYLLSCLKNPHAEFDLDPASEIVFIFQSVTETLAKSVDFNRFREMIRNSPYFRQNFMFDESLESKLVFPGRIEIKPVSGAQTAALGQNVIGGIIDELDFMAVVEQSKRSRDGSTYDQAKAVYDAIARRRKSRFLQTGKQLPGLLCLVSSKNYPGAFTDTKEAEAASDPLIYVYNRRVWEVYPERFRGCKWFELFPGDEFREPRIIDDPSTVSAEDKARCVRIPEDFRKDFASDLNNAVRDIAGVATLALSPFLRGGAWVEKTFGRVPHVLNRTVSDLTEGMGILIHPDAVLNPDEPRWVHLDLSVTGDATGLAIGHVAKFVEKNRGDHIEILPLIVFDVTLAIPPPPGGEIDYSKIRRLVYALSDVFPIKYASADQFQSTDMLQQFRKKGMKVQRVSMDKTIDPYLMLKASLYDGRIFLPENTLLQGELMGLELDSKKGKVDHNPHGTKDVADAACGVVYGLSRTPVIWQRHGVSIRQAPGIIRAPSREDGRTAAEKLVEYLGS